MAWCWWRCWAQYLPTGSTRPGTLIASYAATAVWFTGLAALITTYGWVRGTSVRLGALVSARGPMVMAIVQKLLPGCLHRL
jgi:hypothetical protein